MKNTLITIVVVVALVAGVGYLVTHRAASPTPSASPTPTATVIPTASASATPGPKAPPSPTPGIIIKETKIHQVAIANMGYSPASLTVQKGDVVIFTNNDSVLHSVTSDKGAFNSMTLDPGSQWQLATANMKPGTYTYHCTFHAGMHGTIIIK